MTQLSTETLTDAEEIGLTAVTRIKHQALWKAAKKMGSQAALARHLDVRASDLGKWINLQDCPPSAPNSKAWPVERFADVECKLYELTGMSWDELFPLSLRKSIQNNSQGTTFEIDTSVPVEQLLLGAPREPSRITCDSDERLVIDRAIDHVAAAGGRRAMAIVRDRFGLDGDALTLDECARKYRISRERVRQLESKGIRVLSKAMKSHGTAIDGTAFSVQWQDTTK